MKSQAQLEFPQFKGEALTQLPDDLFIPPEALEIYLEDFSGPMDVLLYLIQKKDIDILELDISEITDQYIKYIELMDALKIELAADYLVMAATLAHIKSRMLIPQSEEEEEEQDPRSELIRRLQEYQRYKSASESISNLPRIDRDFFLATTSLPRFKDQEAPVEISAKELSEIFHEVSTRPKFSAHHEIHFEELSTQDRIALILSILNKRNVIQFFQTYQKEEGKQGVVVSLLASLDLAKDGHVELIQNQDSNQLYLKSTNRGVH
ncbi:ScpA/B protein [SAR86 cluster bacterium SAR86E]|jgi:segregation and condensation protein A|uniref:Segregation and condensation protein A n=1 Tax=SAR86 cluster bacterium SAR86E TaxID=1208365 RepID=K6FB61_9GAMM|nr:ScpA/B protein [SAR86 cluster bacterium SAR86E]